MLDTLKNLFAVADLRNRVLFTLGMLAVYRVGNFIPTPGVNSEALRIMSEQAQNTMFGLYDMFTGGSLSRVTIFALGVMPYISSSIILQLLTVVWPYLERLSKEGELGRRKITQYTRYLTLLLAAVQSLGIAIFLERQTEIAGGLPLVYEPGWSFRLGAMLTLTTGTMFIMWLGEQITERGIGNGMSLLIFTSIAAQFPSSLWSIQQSNGIEMLIVVVAVGILIMGAVVFVEQSQRRIPVQYAKRMVGRRTYGGNNTYIPIKVNMAGVVPVIFASSLLYLPALIAQFSLPADGTAPAAWVVWIQNNLTSGDNPLYMAVYFLLIVGFTYFYVAITFNPEEVADNMKKYGGFIPGIRAGRPTAEYLDYVLTRVTLPGSLYLGLIALIPLFALALINANANFPFGGASILIIVGVGLETVKQIDSQLQQRHYEGLLR